MQANRDDHGDEFEKLFGPTGDYKRYRKWEEGEVEALKAAAIEAHGSVYGWAQGGNEDNYAFAGIGVEDGVWPLACPRL